MTCSDWQTRIAAEPEDPLATGHLSGCRECRDFAQELARNATALRSIDAGATAYTAVRARVMEAVRPKRWFAWLWAATATMSVGCAALVWLTAPLRAPEPPPPQAVVYRIAPPELRPSMILRPVKRRVIKRPSRPQPTQLAAIKLLTDDPNVVIIWLMDKNSGKKGDSL